MAKKKNKDKKPAEDWDLEEGFGGIPEDIPFGKNIGCGGKTQKKDNSKQNDR